MAKSKNIGVFVGAFDPIHEGHLQFAEDAILQNNLDKLYFLVEPRPRYKQGVKALKHRINMVILGVESHDKLGTIVVRSVGIEDYLPILQKRFIGYNLCLIVPEEDVNKLIKWPSIINLDISKFTIAIGVSQESRGEISGKLELLTQTTGIKLNHQVFMSQTKLGQTTEIKSKLRKGERPLEIPESVYEYINQQCLYAASG